MSSSIPFDPSLDPDPDQQDLSADLASPSGEFLTQIDINHVLGNLFQLLAANRISSKRASALANLCSALMKSQRGMCQQIRFMELTAYQFVTDALQEKYGSPNLSVRNPANPSSSDPAETSPNFSATRRSKSPDKSVPAKPSAC